MLHFPFFLVQPESEARPLVKHPVKGAGRGRGSGRARAAQGKSAARYRRSQDGIGSGFLVHSLPSQTLDLGKVREGNAQMLYVLESCRAFFSTCFAGHLMQLSHPSSLGSSQDSHFDYVRNVVLRHLRNQAEYCTTAYESGCLE